MSISSRNLALVLLAACGDNEVPIDGPDLAVSQHLIVVAHTDDDEIFMQPELADWLHGTDSVTTVFVATGDPIKGNAHMQMSFDSSLMAYGAAAGSQAWDCGYIRITGLPVQHCRLDNRISLARLDIPDGGVSGDGNIDLQDLVNGTDTELPIIGALPGTVTTPKIIDELGAIVDQVRPTDLHTLELAGTHGYDHSSHMFTSAYLWWALANRDFEAPITWHRGYNVEDEAEDLTDADSLSMLGYFEACFSGCTVPCGESCPTITSAHLTWIERQYQVTRIPTASGTLTNGTTTLGHFELQANGHLVSNDQCLASTPDGSTTMTPCTLDPAQAWAYDSEGGLWNGVMPAPTGDTMEYDHVRCLTSTGTPVCGSKLVEHWQFVP
ncbi:MAG: PIG-L family deacetylase [Kofleriaceae bacterium]